MLLCVMLQALQDKVQQLEAACADAWQLHASQVAAHDAASHELRSQLEQQRLEVKRVRMEAASLTKQYEQALQRLRREADAGKKQTAIQLTCCKQLHAMCCPLALVHG
jgi:membrane protease subunit (stomatin/prohibitin family)